jgi:hypothetical protein
MISGIKVGADDANAVRIALAGMARKGMFGRGIDREDAEQEMLIKLWQCQTDSPALKLTMARRVGVDLVRQVLGRKGQRAGKMTYADEVPDIGGEADAPDLWLEAKQEIERVMRPATPPAPARKPCKRAVGAPDPRSLRAIPGPPPEPVRPVRSAWAAVWESLTPGGDGAEMTEEQAKAFASWARMHKCKITRRRINGDTYGVWRA